MANHPHDTDNWGTGLAKMQSTNISVKPPVDKDFAVRLAVAF